jgi:cell division septum initiation protein DivIVA
MALTPVEIRHLTPPRTTFRGYQAAATDKLLEDIAASFEDVWRERADLADKVEQLEADLVRFQRRAIAENERLERESRRLRGQLQEALAVFGEPEAAEHASEPETSTATTDEDEVEERSWYGKAADAA